MEEASTAKIQKVNGDLEHLLHMVSDGMLMISKEGRITYVNRALERIVGWKSRDMIGYPFNDPRWNFKCIDESSGSENSVFQNVFQTGQDLKDKICRIGTEKSNQSIFLVNATIHHDEQGQMAGIAALIRDCTELSRVKAENQEIKTVYERLAQ